MSSCEKVNINNIDFNTIVVEKDHDSYTTTTSSVDSSVSTTSKSSTCTWNAYVVLIAAFIAYMLATILTSCFGVFFDNMASDLGLSKSQVAFIGACLSSLDNLMGPVASVLINRRGCRFTTILGGIFLSAGLIGSAFVNQFWLIGLLMGFVSGLGSSFVVVSTVVEVTYHFEDKPSFASGFVISGCCVGQSVFSLIIIKLNEIYGRGGCFLIIGALLLNIVVCGALFKPLSWEREGYEESDSERNEDDEDDDDDAVEEELDIDDDDEEECGENNENIQTKQLMTDTNCDTIKFKYSNDNLKQSNEKEQSFNLITVATDTINDNKIVNIDNSSSSSKVNLSLLEKFLKLFKSNTVTNNKNSEKNSSNNKFKQIIVNNGTDDDNMNNVSKNKLSRSYSISSPVPLLTIEHKHNNHHHHHHHSRHHRNNLPYFANKFPLDFRNIYYKSLINLNTRLMADSPLSHSKDAIQKQQIYKKDISHENNNMSLLQVDDESNVISLSCPNLTNTQISGINDPQLTVEALNYRLNKYKNLMNNKKLNKNKHFNKMIGVNNESEEDMDERSKSKCLNTLKQMSSIKFIKKVSKRLLRSIIESLKLFKIFKYTIFVLCIFNAGLFYESPFYFINSYMTENGFSQEKAGTVTVAIGVVCIFAAIGYGYVGDLKRINWIILTSISLFLTGICNFLIPLCIQNYFLTMLTIVSLGVFIMSNDVLMPMICVNTVGPDDFVSAYGLIFFCQGISSLIGPPILGMIVDYTGSYAYSYNIGGIGFCISGAILLINLLYKSKNENENNKNPKEKQDQVNTKIKNKEQV